jgi:aminopeptidase N
VDRVRVLLADETAVVELPTPLDWVVVNDGAWGFYRVRYEAGLLERLTAVMGRQLQPLERLTLVSDTWAAVIAGQSPLADYLHLVGLLGDESDPDVWSAVIGPLGLLDQVIDDADRGALQSFVRRVAGPSFARLGWDPENGEPERIGTLRARLLQALGTLGADLDVRASSAARLRAYLDDRSALAADLVTAVVTVVAGAGGEDEYERMLEQFQKATTPQDEIRYLYALAAPEDGALLQRTLELCLSPAVRTQDAPYLLATVLASRAGHRLAWRFLTEHWEGVLGRFPSNSIPRLLEAVAALADAELAPEIHRFLDSHPVPQGELQIAQARERLDVNVAFARRAGPTLAAALTA